MIITGYHGTSKRSAVSILLDGYNISTGDTQWLGDGIYFYYDYSSALDWAKRFNPGAEIAVLHSVITVAKNEVIDFDSEDGRNMMYWILKLANHYQVGFSETEIQKNQSTMAKLAWELNDHCKVLCASFPSEKSWVKLLLDYRPKRKEFCVRTMDPIKSTTLLEVVNDDNL